MDCNNCTRDGMERDLRMYGGTTAKNGRNMYYGRNSRGNMNCSPNMNRYPMRGQVMGGRINRSDDCDKGNEPVDRMQIAMGYVPWQDWENVCSVDRALEMGTIFEDLYKPYKGRSMK